MPWDVREGLGRSRVSHSALAIMCSVLRVSLVPRRHLWILPAHGTCAVRLSWGMSWIVFVTSADRRNNESKMPRAVPCDGSAPCTRTTPWMATSERQSERGHERTSYSCSAHWCPSSRFATALQKFVLMAVGKGSHAPTPATASLPHTFSLPQDHAREQSSLIIDDVVAAVRHVIVACYEPPAEGAAAASWMPHTVGTRLAPSLLSSLYHCGHRSNLAAGLARRKLPPEVHAFTRILARELVHQSPAVRSVWTCDVDELPSTLVSTLVCAAL